LNSFDKAIVADPTLSNGYYYKGICLNSLKRYSEAITSLNKAVELNHNFAEAFNSKFNN
jgi:tetratricopeptide (TPR) repeat protein